MYSGHPYRDESRYQRRGIRDFLSTAGRALVIVALVAAGVAAYFRWPRLNVVETGRTPGYLDLKVRAYDKSPADIAHAARGVAERLGWTYVGSGSGRGGGEIKAIVRPFHLPLRCDVTVRIKGSGERSAMTVRSESRYGPWDFGQNARNISAFLREMDIEME